MPFKPQLVHYKCKGIIFIKHLTLFYFPSNNYMQAQRDDIAKMKEDLAQLVQALTPSGGN